MNSDMVDIFILVKNEEKNIIDVVQNAKKCSQNVIVVDGGSNDNTVALARESGAEVIYRTWDNDFAAQRNFALQKAKSNWVLYLDADERLNDELIEAVKNRVVKNEQKQYVIKRKSTAFNQEFNYGVLRPDHVARLFPKDEVLWVNKVHEKPVCSLPKENLTGYIKHYTYANWEQYFGKFNQYTTIWAQSAYENKKTTTILGAYLHAVGGFLQMAFIKKGLLDGKMGFVLSCNHFFYTFIKYIKLYHLCRDK